MKSPHGAQDTGLSKDKSCEAVKSDPPQDVAARPSSLEPPVKAYPCSQPVGSKQLFCPRSDAELQEQVLTLIRTRSLSQGEAL